PSGAAVNPATTPSTAVSATSPPQTPGGTQRFAASSGPSVSASPARTAFSSATELRARSEWTARTTPGGPSVGNASVHAAYTTDPTAVAAIPPVGAPSAVRCRNW